MYTIPLSLYVHVVLFLHRFDFIVTPLMHPRYKKEYFGISSERPGPVTRSDKVLTGSEWGSYVVGKVSPWIQLDSALEDVRMNSAKVKLETWNPFSMLFDYYKLCRLFTFCMSLEVLELQCLSLDYVTAQL